MAKRTYTHFGPWLGEQLHEHDLSASDFAATVGVLQPTVYRWTAGQRLPWAPGLVERIAEALAVAPSAVWDVIEREGAPGVVRPAASARPVAQVVPAGPTAPRAERPFAVWLRSALAARDWTPADLAGRLDIDVNSPRLWTRGRRTPVSAQLPRLAEVLGVSVETIEEVLAR